MKAKELKLAIELFCNLMKTLKYYLKAILDSL